MSLTVVLPDGTRVVNGKTLYVRGEENEEDRAARIAEFQIQWNAAMQIAWEETRDYLLSIGQEVPSSLFATATTQLTDAEAEDMLNVTWGNPIDTHQAASDLITSRVYVAQGVTDGVNYTTNKLYENIGQTRMNQLFSKSQNWYTGTGLHNGVQNESAIGRVFMGLLQERETAKAFDDFQKMTSVVEAASLVTGIPTGGLRYALLFSRTTAESEALLRQYFEGWGYAHIFQSASQAPGTTEANTGLPHPTAVRTDRQFYDGNSKTVRVTFDWSSPTVYDHANIYVVVNGQTFGVAIPINGGIHGRTFVDVPLSEIRKQLEGTPYANTVDPSWFIQLRLQVQDGQGNFGPALSRTTSLFQVEEAERLTFDPSEVLGQTQWAALTAAQQDQVRAMLDFGEMSELPEKNRQLITWLVDHFLRSDSTEENKMTYDAVAMKWVGLAYDTSTNSMAGECKYWIQQNVVLTALGILLPNNSTATGAHSWQESELVAPITSSDNEGMTLQEAFANEQISIQAGDMIQMAKNGQQHTVIVGKVDADGFWVFDSNSELDDAPRYHKMLFANESSTLFTIYRLN